MNIVFAKESHAEALAGIVKSTFHLACPKDSNPDLQLAYISKHLSTQKFKEFIVSDDNIVLAAVEESELVALAVIEKVTSNLACLSKLYVLPKCHGKGIAINLFEEAFKQVKKSKYKTLNLTVYSGNTKAKAFYEKKGFKLIGECEFLMETELHKDHVYEMEVV